MRLGKAVELARVAAADPREAAIFEAKSALKSAGAIRNAARATFYAAEAEVDQLSALVKRLENDR